MNELRLEDFRVHGFIDRFQAMFWVYVRSFGIGFFRHFNLWHGLNFFVTIVAACAYMSSMFLSSLVVLSQVLACAMDVCVSATFWKDLAIGIGLLVFTFAPMLALMYIGTYYKVGDFLAVALLMENKDSIGIYGLTGRRAGARRKDSSAPGVLDTISELAPVLLDYADRHQKKIVLTADAKGLQSRYIALLGLEEEKGLLGTKLVRHPNPEPTLDPFVPTPCDTKDV